MEQNNGLTLAHLSIKTLESFDFEFPLFHLEQLPLSCWWMISIGDWLSMVLGQHLSGRSWIRRRLCHHRSRSIRIVEQRSKLDARSVVQGAVVFSLRPQVDWLSPMSGFWPLG